MLDLSEIKKRVMELELPDPVGGSSPLLSYPVILRREEKLLCIFMHFLNDDHDRPGGYAFCDMETGKASYMRPEKAMEFMGMPEEILYEKIDYDRAPFGPVEDPGDPEELFDACIKDGIIDREAYSLYLATVCTLSMPGPGKFYFWFYRESFPDK